MLPPAPTPRPAPPSGDPLDRLGVWPVVLDFLGGFTILSLVLGLPAAARWWSGWGFLAGLALVFLLTSTTAISAAIAVGRTGRAGWPRLRWGGRFLNPFAAGRAGEGLREAALSALPPLQAAQRLLEPDRFAAWLRPRVYDRRSHGPGADPELDQVLSPEAQAALLASVPAGAGPGETWCPRCAGLYRPAADTCADCGVALRRAKGEERREK